MKRKLVIAVFSVLILATAVCFLIAAVCDYNSDIARQDDIMQGFGAAMLLALGGVIVFYEADLFFTVYTLLLKPKRTAEKVLNILSNLSFGLFLAYIFLSESIMELRKFESVEYFLIPAYLLLRIGCCFASAVTKSEGEQ